MCRSRIGRVASVTADLTSAVLDVDGAPTVVSLAPITLTGRTVRTGDWVQVHTGFAVDVLDERDAWQLLDLDPPTEAAR